MAERKDQAVPEGWGTDASGSACTDPSRILDEGGLMPVGGKEITGIKMRAAFLVVPTLLVSLFIL